MRLFAPHELTCIDGARLVSVERQPEALQYSLAAFARSVALCSNSIERATANRSDLAVSVEEMGRWNPLTSALCSSSKLTLDFEA